MPAELELVGPLWADFGNHALYRVAFTIEVVVAVCLFAIVLKRFRLRTWYARCVVSTLLSGMSVIMFNGVLNVIVLAWFASIYRSAPQ